MYIVFCKKFGVNPLPANESTLCYYVTWLGQKGLQYSTIRTYLSGVRQIQIAHGFPDPKFDGIPNLCQILQGVKVVAGLQGHSKRIRLPITPSILQKMKTIWVGGEENFDKVMLWAAVTTTFLSSARLEKLPFRRENL